MIRLDDIIEKVSSYSPEADLDVIRKAYVFSAKEHAGQTRMSGEEYLVHPIEVANILTELKMDPKCVATGLLHDTVEDTHTTIEQIEELFGPDISLLVDGLTKLGQMSYENKKVREAESIRKMILAMARDIRVVIIKLADRLHNMRTLDALSPEKQTVIAQETMDIYAPLANRLGVGWIKTELEDLAFKYIDPERYAWIEKNVSRKREEKEKYIARVREVIETKLREAGIEGEVSGRVKHRYSIYKKMQERDIDFDDLHDMLAFRVIVENEDDCYPLLGMVHSTWKPVPGRFKDYIAIPKANMYQSLHTTVIGPYGEMMEVQIRTRNMHLVSEYGVAAHWKYKDGEKISDTYHAGLSWLSQMLEMQKDVKDSSEFLETLKVDLFPDEVFVFTPQGEVRELPAGSTPIDFAYSIHTDIGHSCVNARVNGRRVPLSYTLRNGDFVEIETREDARPNAEWIGFVATSRARNRIKQWINAAERKESFELGHELLRKAFLMYGFNFDELIEKGELQEKAGEPLGYDSDEKLILNVGFGKITPGQVVSKIVPPELLKEDGAVKRSVFRQMLNRIRPAAKSSQDKKRPSVIVKGAGDFMVNIANCCNPLPGDEITGYLTPERGILVHSYDCPSLLSSDYERRIDVEWEEGAERVTPVKIVVFCKNDVGLLADIAIALKEQDANIASAKVRSTSDNRAVCAFDVSVRDIVHLRNVIRALKDIKKVIKVKRVGFDKHGKPLRRVAS